MTKIGLQTIKFDSAPYILETSSIVGPKEAEGPLAKYLTNAWKMSSGEKRLGKKLKVKLLKKM